MDTVFIFFIKIWKIPRMFEQLVCNEDLKAQFFSNNDKILEKTNQFQNVSILQDWTRILKGERIFWESRPLQLKMFIKLLSPPFTCYSSYKKYPPSWLFDFIAVIINHGLKKWAFL